MAVETPRKLDEVSEVFGSRAVHLPDPTTVQEHRVKSMRLVGAGRRPGQAEACDDLAHTVAEKQDGTELGQLGNRAVEVQQCPDQLDLPALRACQVVTVV